MLVPAFCSTNRCESSHHRSKLGRSETDALNLKSMLSPRVFIITSLDPDGQRVQDTVRRAIEEDGFRVVQHRAAVRPGAELTSSILDGIREADLIIADVSRQNPSVFYEVGFAHALRKPTILLFDFIGVQISRYRLLPVLNPKSPAAIPIGNPKRVGRR